jgi:hypothetical protein
VTKRTDHLSTGLTFRTVRLHRCAAQCAGRAAAEEPRHHRVGLRSSGFEEGREFAQGGRLLRAALGSGWTMDARHVSREFGAKNFYGPSPSKEWTDQTLVGADWLRTRGNWSTTLRVFARNHGDHFRWDVNRPASQRTSIGRTPRGEPALAADVRRRNRRRVWGRWRRRLGAIDEPRRSRLRPRLRVHGSAETTRRPRARHGRPACRRLFNVRIGAQPVGVRCPAAQFHRSRAGLGGPCVSRADVHGALLPRPRESRLPGSDGRARLVARRRCGVVEQGMDRGRLAIRAVGQRRHRLGARDSGPSCGARRT